VDLKPYVWQSTFEAPVVLYEGGLRLHFDGDTIDGVGQVCFEWRPRPAVEYRFATKLGIRHVLRVEDKPALRVELLGSPSDVPVPPNGAQPVATESLLEGWNYCSKHELNRQEFGSRATPVVRVLFHLINYAKYPLPDSIDTDTRHYMGRLVLRSDDWSVVIEKPPDDEAYFDDLQNSGSYAFTHLAEVRRSDGRPFSVDDIEGLEDDLLHFLGFVKGSLVGLALPVAYDEHDQPSWSAWQVTVVDRWRSSMNWCEWTHLGELSDLFAGWLRRTKEPFWREILRRAVPQCLTANNPNPVDVAVPVSFSTLELLAWAVLFEDQQWLNEKDGKLNMAGRTRLLLRWAGIDPTIDSRLTALTALAKRENCIDGPDVLAFVRNRLVHPLRRAKEGPPDWPSWETQIDAWRLVMQYVELVILRLLDHQGRYGSRFHMEGRWPGQIEPVPWAR